MLCCFGVITDIGIKTDQSSVLFAICAANQSPSKQERLLQFGDVARDDGDRHLLTPQKDI